MYACMYVYIHMNHVPLVLTGSQTCGLLLLCLWLPMLSARSVFPIFILRIFTSLMYHFHQGFSGISDSSFVRQMVVVGFRV